MIVLRSKDVCVDLFFFYIDSLKAPRFEINVVFICQPVDKPEFIQKS